MNQSHNDGAATFMACLGVFIAFFVLSGFAFWFFVVRDYAVSTGAHDPSCFVGFHWIQDLPAYPYHGICEPDANGSEVAADTITKVWLDGYNTGVGLDNKTSTNSNEPCSIYNSDGSCEVLQGPTSVQMNDIHCQNADGSHDCDWPDNPVSATQAKTWNCQNFSGDMKFMNGALFHVVGSSTETLSLITQTTGTSTPQSMGYSDCTQIR